MFLKISVLFLLIVFSFCYTKAFCPNIISRSSWGAQSPKERTVLHNNPLPYVVAHHSETPSCATTEKCKQRVKIIQDYHMNENGWSDIGYNFLIGGDGNVYEGRGWGIQGAHAPNYNSRSIGICLIGSFQNEAPPVKQLEILEQLMACGVKKNYLKTNYYLVGHRQVRATDCPGDKLYTEIKMMPHWIINPN